MTSGKVTKLKRRDEKAALKHDLEVQLEAGIKARDAKLAQSKEHLLNQLNVASEKYLTVNGYMQARTALEQAAFGDREGADAFSDDARYLASEMSKLAGELATKLGKIDVMDLSESLVDGLLDVEFNKLPVNIVYTARQLLIVNLLQNVGPVIAELVEWREGVAAGIATLEAELAKEA